MSRFEHSNTKEITVLKAETAYMNVKHYGAKGDGTTDDTTAIQSAFNTGYAVYFPSGTYLISDTITIGENSSLYGDGARRSIIKSTLTGNKHLFIANVGTDANFGISVTGLRFLGINTTALDGYALRLTGGNTARISECDFRHLGGGAVWADNCTTLTIDKCYVGFNANNATYKNAGYGAIHTLDAPGQLMNSVTVSNCYISNNKFMDGIKWSGNAGRFVYNTIETSDYLINIGQQTTVSRSITIQGNYLENAYKGDIFINNIKGGSVVSNYHNNTTGPGSPTCEFAVAFRYPCESIEMHSCYLDTKGIGFYDPVSSYRKVIVKNCQGTKMCATLGGVAYDGETYGATVEDYYKQSYDGHGGYGLTQNQLTYSDDLSMWTNNGLTLAQDTTFTDGSAAYTITKSGTATSDIYLQKTMTVSTGSLVCFSVFAKNGQLSLKIRGRRTSDSVFEDIQVNYATTSSDKWEQVYASFKASKDYNLVQMRMSPNTYSDTTGTVSVCRAQYQLGSLYPTQPIKTIGTAVTTSNIKGVTNGNHYTVGKNLSVEGLGVGNSAIAATLGTLSKKMEVFDANGSSLGFIPIYTTIT